MIWYGLLEYCYFEAAVEEPGEAGGDQGLGWGPAYWLAKH